MGKFSSMKYDNNWKVRVCRNRVSITLPLIVVPQAPSERKLHLRSTGKKVITDQWVAFQYLGNIYLYLYLYEVISLYIVLFQPMSLLDIKKITVWGLPTEWPSLERISWEKNFPIPCWLQKQCFLYSSGPSFILQ